MVTRTRKDGVGVDCRPRPLIATPLLVLALEDVVDLEHLGLARKLDPDIAQDRHEAVAERVELLLRARLSGARREVPAGPGFARPKPKARRSLRDEARLGRCMEPHSETGLRHTPVRELWNLPFVLEVAT
jgi:hypothetical protein